MCLNDLQTVFFKTIIFIFNLILQFLDLLFFHILLLFVQNHGGGVQVSEPCSSTSASSSSTFWFSWVSYFSLNSIYSSPMPTFAVAAKEGGAKVPFQFYLKECLSEKNMLKYSVLTWNFWSKLWRLCLKKLNKKYLNLLISQLLEAFKGNWKLYFELWNLKTDL